jgi:hypothetical protein
MELRALSASSYLPDLKLWCALLARRVLIEFRLEVDVVVEEEEEGESISRTGQGKRKKEARERAAKRKGVKITIHQEAERKNESLREGEAGC